MKFVIWAPIYNDNSGGVIVLHKLASMLRDMGHIALIWPEPKPSRHELKSLCGWVKLAKWIKFLIKNFLKKRRINTRYDLQIAKELDIVGAVVIYPEVVAGNPLNSRCVIRWLLNKPGVINGVKEFGGEDLFFYYHKHFNDWELNPHEDRHLNVLELMTDVYQKTNDGDRKEQCYMVRKGRNRALDYHDASAREVDGLTHAELAKVFNECKYFICYDLYTMYCRYASMCGCIPIVVPQEGLSREEWRPEVENRYGIAYGWEDSQWAIETRSKVLENLAESENQGVDSINRFVDIVERYFSGKFN